MIGGAEVIKSRCTKIPSWYDQVHRQLARDGNRILALASKKLEFSTRAELILASRDQIEDSLEFNGFLITGSPLKDSVEHFVIREKLVFVKTSKMLRILTEHIKRVCSLKSKLFNLFMFH